MSIHDGIRDRKLLNVISQTISKKLFFKEQFKIP